MSTTIAMLAPDGTSGEIPIDKIDAAKQAGFKVAVQMKSPEGQNGYIPADRVHDAAAKGFKMVPLQAPDAVKASYWDALTNPIGSGGQEQGVLGAIKQVGGQAISAAAQPFMHPVQALGGLAKLASSASDPYALAETVARPVVEKYVADKQQGGHALAAENLAGNLIGQAESGRVAGAGISGVEGGSLMKGRIPGALDFAAKIPNPITATKNLMAGPPEAQLTKAFQPAKNNVNFGSDLKIAAPQMKAAEAQLGKPIATYEDAAQANSLAKKQIWGQVQNYLNQTGRTGATIDGNAIADAMMGSIDKRMALQNPGVYAKVKALADTYRRDIPVSEAEDFIQSNNAELQGYYAKNKVNQQAAMADPEINAKVIEGNQLRDALYSKINDLSGPGVAQLKKAYGALSNVQKELAGQQIVYARKAPVNLGEQLGYLQAGGKILTGDVIGGAKDIAVRRFLSDLNDKESMIARAFDQTQPAAPFLMPKAMPIIKGQLPAQAGGNFEIPPANPMTPGERSAALLHMLRQRQQLQLPASAEPIKLPPSF